MNYSPQHYDTWKLAAPEEHFGWADEACGRCGGPWDDSGDEDHCSICLEEARAVGGDLIGQGKRGSVGK